MTRHATRMVAVAGGRVLLLDRFETQKADSRPDVSVFALKALATIVSDLKEKSVKPDTHYLCRLVIAVKSPDQSKLNLAVQQMHEAGIGDSEILERYVPAVARQLEQDWQTDRADFVSITIATSRMQGLLRRMAADWDVPRLAAPKCLVTVPQGEQHTLGASILTMQLRKQSLDVQQMLDPSDSKLSQITLAGDFSAIMISSYDGNCLEPLHRMIKSLRASNAKVPIIIGGSILDRHKDICWMVRADHATNNWQEALRVCGLTNRTLTASSPMSGS